MPYEFDVDDYLMHYGKKGMKWGVRQQGPVRAARKIREKTVGKGVEAGKKQHAANKETVSKAFTLNKKYRDEAAAKTGAHLKKQHAENKETVKKAFTLNAKYRDRALDFVAKKVKAKITLKRAAPTVAITLNGGRKGVERIKQKIGDRPIKEIVKEIVID